VHVLVDIVNVRICMV